MTRLPMNATSDDLVRANVGDWSMISEPVVTSSSILGLGVSQDGSGLPLARVSHTYRSGSLVRGRYQRGDVNIGSRDVNLPLLVPRVARIHDPGKSSIRSIRYHCWPCSLIHAQKEVYQSKAVSLYRIAAAETTGTGHGGRDFPVLIPHREDFWQNQASTVMFGDPGTTITLCTHRPFFDATCGCRRRYEARDEAVPHLRDERHYHVQEIHDDRRLSRTTSAVSSFEDGDNADLDRRHLTDLGIGPNNKGPL